MTDNKGMDVLMAQVEQAAVAKLVRAIAYVAQNDRLDFVSTYWMLKAETYMCRAFRRHVPDYYVDMRHMKLHGQPLNIVHTFGSMSYLQSWADQSAVLVRTLGLYQYAHRVRYEYSVESLSTLVRSIRKQNVVGRIERVLNQAVNQYHTMIKETNCEPI